MGAEKQRCDGDAKKGLFGNSGEGWLGGWVVSANKWRACVGGCRQPRVAVTARRGCQQARAGRHSPYSLQQRRLEPEKARIAGAHCR